MNIRQIETLYNVVRVTEVVRMMLERPDRQAAATNQRAQNERLQSSSDFEYGAARFHRKTRDFLEITAGSAVAVVAPGAPEFRQNIGARHSILTRQNEAPDGDAELTFSIDGLDFLLEGVWENFFEECHHT